MNDHGERNCVVRTKIHDVVSANGTVIDNNVPGPECNGVPLFRISMILSPERKRKQNPFLNMTSDIPS
jgi:hypothetical protein